MIVGGYRLKGYDATYEKTTFDVRSKVNGETCVLEILENLSGVTYIVELDKNNEFCRRIRKKKHR